MKKFSKQEQRLLAIWAVKCARRVLPIFEKKFPKDKRSRKALQTAKEWIRTGIFSMVVIRCASLSAHAAARRAEEDSPARFAARTASQAVATAHVPQHAFGAPYYAIKAIAAANQKNAKSKAAKEYKWQMRQLPKKLRKAWQEWQSRRIPKGLKLLIR